MHQMNKMSPRNISQQQQQQPCQQQKHQHHHHHQQNQQQHQPSSQQDVNTDTNSSDQFIPPHSSTAKQHYNSQFMEQRLEKQQNLPYDKIIPHDSMNVNNELAKVNQNDLNILIDNKNYHHASKNGLKCDNYSQPTVIHDATTSRKLEDLQNTTQNLQNED